MFQSNRFFLLLTKFVHPIASAYMYSLIW